ncbi:MAG: hypothetical protein R3C99_11360 [Pirellulaceae bacterium]
MRVFPLEPRREKRILISYTQRLPEMFGQLRYHFPAGHTMDQVRDWSAQIKVRHGDNWQWQSVSHAFDSKTEQDDLILTAKGHDIRLDRDLLLELTPPQSYTPQATPFASFATTFHDGSQYLQLRYWPHLSLPPRRERRDWILLFEASGDRDPIVARAQVEILRSLLDNAEHHDTFSLLTAGTRMHAWRPQASDATPENITEAIAWLENSHLVGAMDVERAYRAIAPLVRQRNESHDCPLRFRRAHSGRTRRLETCRVAAKYGRVCRRWRWQAMESRLDETRRRAVGRILHTD